jgi:ubiquinone/menaquinone biosynthesis C-methylase UbiE
MNAPPIVTLHRAILGEFGHTLTPTSTILDFGCGDGHMVAAYREAGLQAVGADLDVAQPNAWLRLISSADYSLPFPDETFDFVFSNSVFEHIEDFDRALSEIHRVLKPGAASLHLFPPAATPIEPHVFVPLGGLLRPRWWLSMWALMGVRNSFQRGRGWREIAAVNYAYLHQKTFYRSKGQLKQLFARRFRRVVFADREMIRHSYGRARHLARLGPVVARLYGACHQRCVFLAR